MIPAPGSASGVRLVPNPRAAGRADLSAKAAAVLPRDGFEQARRVIESWPGYAPTPLRPLRGLAARLGIGALWYKDEAGRFGLASFKALGGAYAVAEHVLRAAGPGVTFEDLLGGRLAAVARPLTVACATDGNHGRSVAWGARLFGCRAVIFVHATVSEGRKRAIEAYGAEVRRTAGNYDQSVREAEATAAAEGWTVVSDTSYPGYTEIPKDVMQGYGVMATEAFEQLPAGQVPSHIFIQGGVGGLAAAIAIQSWWRFGSDRPRLVVVEPATAACLLVSAEAGVPVIFPGDLETVMAGLSCGEPSLLAWAILDEAADAFMTISDEAAIDVMRHLAAGRDGDPPVVAGESATAGLAGLIAALADAEIAAALALSDESRVLVFGTEGATDPELYRQLVGRAAAEVGG